jgi:hypothetical protein
MGCMHAVLLPFSWHLLSQRVVTLAGHSPPGLVVLLSLQPTAHRHASQAACLCHAFAAPFVFAAGLPLLQPRHRSLVRPTFVAVAKALESVGSPWGQLRAALHLEVAKAEADADSFIKVSGASPAVGQF